MKFLVKSFVTLTFEPDLQRLLKELLQSVLSSKPREEDCCHKKKVHEERLLEVFGWV